MRVGSPHWVLMVLLSGVGVGMALTSPDEEGEMATNALVVLQVISMHCLLRAMMMPMVMFQKGNL